MDVEPAVKRAKQRPALFDFFIAADRDRNIVRVYMQPDGYRHFLELQGTIERWLWYSDDKPHLVSIAMRQGTVVTFFTKGDGWERFFERVEHGVAPRDLECLDCCALVAEGDLTHRVYAAPGVMSSSEEFRGVLCRQCLAGGENGR